MKVQCVGSRAATNHAVYLHGMYGNRRSPTEQSNVANLRRLAKFLDLQIAIPASEKACHFEDRWQRCWGDKMTPRQAKFTLFMAEKAAATCFSKDEPYGIIGFGNGGYMATKIFAYCLAPRYTPRMQWIVTVGAAKLWSQGVSVPGSLKRCRPITLVAGKRDRYNYQRDQSYFQHLRRKGAEISIVVFDGGHELPFGPLVSALRKHLELP